jgi:hypothetical protein
VEKAKPLIVTKTGARTLPNVAATSKGDLRRRSAALVPHQRRREALHGQ